MSEVGFSVSRKRTICSFKEGGKAFPLWRSEWVHSFAEVARQVIEGLGTAVLRVVSEVKRVEGESWKRHIS